MVGLIYLVPFYTKPFQCQSPFDLDLNIDKQIFEEQNGDVFTI